jgi:crotonobetainyl-CoA:carnitine CoA-transferase CaiB-like acyl-CoA transferase
MPKENRKQPFDGVKIVSFAWAVVGPVTMRYFADYGARVIRIETRRRPDLARNLMPIKDGKPGVNRSGYFNHFNTNILSMSLNMENPAAIDLAKRLITQADVVLENFTPGVMEKWGLGYEELKQLKSDIIMVRQSGFGTYGPYVHQPAFGMVLAAIAGLPNFIGWPDGLPLPVGISAYTDYIGPRFASAALIAALDHRDKTGEGMLLDISHFETTIYFLLPAVLDYISNGRKPKRIGNASQSAAPHGVYQCKGEDRWCAIAILNDEEWKSFCNVIAKPELVEDPRFQTSFDRVKNRVELDRMVNQWSVHLTAEEVMVKLQTAGIAAGVVKNGADIYKDPQLRHRGYFWELNHPEIGPFTHLGQSFVLSKTPAEARRPSPCLGEHTESICKGFLNMSNDEFTRLSQMGVFE